VEVSTHEFVIPLRGMGICVDDAAVLPCRHAVDRRGDASPAAIGVIIGHERPTKRPRMGHERPVSAVYFWRKSLRHKEKWDFGG
jgi:hypothetical protein